MKRITYILIPVVLTFGACTDFLDIEPHQSISDTEAIKDKAGVDHAITGSYSALQMTGLFGRYQVIVQDLVADNLKWTGTTQDYGQIDNNVVPADNGIVDGIWAANYDCINRVNNVLYRLPGISDLTPQERDGYEGEALFLRALCHFNLLSYFGGIPLKTQPTLDLSNIDQVRNTVEEVYARIIEDLQAAEEKLPSTSALGRASSFSTTALLAKVYLTEYHFNNNPDAAAQAIAKAEKVINEGGYSLASNYVDLFNGNTTESIFEVVFDVQNRNVLAQYFFPRSLTGRYEVAPTTEFVESWDPGDSARFKATIAFDTATAQPYGIKYKDVAGGTDRVYVLRLAEMYLIRAEALAWSNGPIEAIQNDINVIRNRAGLPPTEAADHSALKLAVQRERRFEFAFECQRWSDLVRTGTATIVMGIDEDQTLFPIPLSEMQTNKKMKQNPGY